MSLTLDQDGPAGRGDGVALLSTGHDGCAYALTGPERTSPSAQTRLLGDLLTRPLTFEAVPAEAGIPP
ncbi:hypothetical protein FE391_07870 [Nonomuraea sp. KC401]|uniref:hypothetical protein n=1 Tax=unclassified Nonomuraea TaxID=2593643 RepID=UPI0010FD6938|nr:MULTISPECIES: hypothetical protein [unclassified Nonomuraea]NBE96068.1 hypothetical protein [Nonomuraea sp. K271]TLF80267.1 hypothetical protein FE391_07870 [Nonomuraea sp. KC401]